MKPQTEVKRPYESKQFEANQPTLFDPISLEVNPNYSQTHAVNNFSFNNLLPLTYEEVLTNCDNYDLFFEFDGKGYLIFSNLSNPENWYVETRSQLLSVLKHYSAL